MAELLLDPSFVTPIPEGVRFIQNIGPCTVWIGDTPDLTPGGGVKVAPGKWISWSNPTQYYALAYGQDGATCFTLQGDGIVIGASG